MRAHILAKDYVEGMWRILQQSAPEDFVLATGETHPVREYVEKAFGVVGISIKYVQHSYLRSLSLIHTRLVDGVTPAWRRKATTPRQAKCSSRWTLSTSVLLK